MIKRAIVTLTEGKDLDYEMASGVMNEIFTGEATPVQIAGFLTALHMKGESVVEITALAEGMRAAATPFDRGGDALDIVGTGGDRAYSVNISTMSALLSAAAGCRVAKHGSRSSTSFCGSSECLEALGANISLEPDASRKILDEIGFTFLYAQKYHPAMRYVSGVRRDLGIPTIFNILGPHANPAKANIQLMGVYSESLVEPLAHVLANVGVERGMVVYGTDGLDEISLSSPTVYCSFEGEHFECGRITPEQFGFKRCKKDELVGGNPEVNAAIARRTLSGEPGPVLDSVLLNAGVAIHLYQKISIEEGIAAAREAVASGRAKQTLEDYVALTRKYAAD